MMFSIRKPAESSTDLLKLEYEQANQNFRALADTRFKLLGLLPLFGGAAIFVLSILGLSPELGTLEVSSGHLWFVVGVSGLGFFVTLGIVIYDQRNSELYNCLVHRLRYLETRFDSPISPGARRKAAFGGQFIERAPRSKMMLWFEVGHDLGLALIYGSILGAWVFPFSLAAVRLVAHIPHFEPIQKGMWLGYDMFSMLVALLVSVSAILGLTQSLIRLDRLERMNWDEAGKKAVLILVEKTPSGFKASASQLGIARRHRERKEALDQLTKAVKEKRLALEQQGREINDPSVEAFYI
jgi:hypothetical protein